jgi:arylsulfatase A-like enzyme/Flp pilus assembly protein TadD
MNTALLRFLCLCLLLPSCARPAPDAQPVQSPPDVVLITVDTLRADRVGGPLTPAINAIGARGARFISARTTVPLTLPAHVSLMTGAIPPATGVRLNGVHRFDGSRPTLARLFKDAGRDTAAFIGAFVLDRQFGLGAGFDTYDDQIARSPGAPLRLEAERPASAVADRAIAWVRGRQQPAGQPRRPFFLWAHFYDPHAPYAPPSEALDRAGGNAYDGEVTYADAEIGRVLRAVSEIGGDGRTLVVIMGDHGESLGEHGERTHGMLLYDGVLRIPLVIAGPGAPAGERRQPVSIVDVAPTVLRLAGLGVPAGMQGRDLFSGSAAHEVYAETLYPRTLGWSPLTALVEERWKVIAPEGGGEELYDLERDPGERENASARKPEVVQAAAARLSAIRKSETGTSVSAPSAEAQDRLRALGYVGSAPAQPSSGGAPNPATQIGTWVAFEDVLDRLNSGRPVEAVTKLALLSAANPHAHVIAETYARTLSELGRHREALAIYRNAVRARPDDSILLHDLAVAAQRAGRRNEALKAEQAAIALDPRNGAAHNGLGLLLVEDSRLDGARQAFERAVAADTSSAEYVVNLGNAKRASGDRAGAEKSYRSALVLDPGSANALNGLAVLLIESGRPLDAIPYLLRASQSDPDLWEARLNLGIAHQTAGQLDAAAAAYRAVLAAPARYARERRAAAELLASLTRNR